MDIKLNKRVSLRPIQSDLACLSVAQIGPNPLGPAYCAIRGRFAFSKRARPTFQPLRIRRPAFVAVDRHDGRGRLTHRGHADGNCPADADITDEAIKIVAKILRNDKIGERSVVDADAGIVVVAGSS